MKDSDALARIEKVTRLIDDNEIEMALEIVEELLIKYERDPEILILSAELKKKLERMDEAEKDLLEATAKDPKLAKAWRSLGEIYADQEKAKKAKEAYQRAIEIDPHDYETLVGLSAILYAEGMHAEAEEMLYDAISIDPTNALALSALGIYMLAKQDLETAESLLRRAVELGPDKPLPLGILAITLRMQGREDEAEEFQAMFDELTEKR